jgi:hypothetical protein
MRTRQLGETGETLAQAVNPASRHVHLVAAASITASFNARH